MDYYFKGEFTTFSISCFCSESQREKAGKFLPFLKKEGLKAFKLILCHCHLCFCPLVPVPTLWAWDQRAKGRDKGKSGND